MTQIKALVDSGVLVSDDVYMVVSKSENIFLVKQSDIFGVLGSYCHYMLFRAQQLAMVDCMLFRPFSKC